MHPVRGLIDALDCEAVISTVAVHFCINIKLLYGSLFHDTSLKVCTCIAYAQSCSVKPS